MLGAQPQNVPAPSQVVELDPVSLIVNASGPVFFVVWLLIAASVAVWVIAALKLLQLRRWSAAQDLFEAEAARAAGPDQLFAAADQHDTSPGGRVVRQLRERLGCEPRALPAVAKRAVVAEQQRASTLMPTLASIGSASPFVGLFGTVYGIMDAFLRIGREKSASLPVVAPAIGEALIATAIGLFAAIPAVVAYNAINKRMDDMLTALEAASEGWVEVIMPAAEAEASETRARLEQAEEAAARLAASANPRHGGALGSGSAPIPLTHSEPPPGRSVPPPYPKS